jgi:hypothetical protein
VAFAPEGRPSQEPGCTRPLLSGTRPRADLSISCSATPTRCTASPTHRTVRGWPPPAVKPP